MVDTNLVSRYDADRIVREDLSDVIELMSQEDTPYTSNIGRGKAKQTFHEWNTDSLMTTGENAAIEGDDATITARTMTTRMGDYTQIMRKTLGVTGTLAAIDVVGGKDALAREIMKAGRELKLDREYRLVRVGAAAPGNDTTARQMAGFGAWIRTNVSRGATGTNPALSGTTEGYPSASPGDGTARAFTETLVKTVMGLCYGAGGKPTMMMMPPNLKVQSSAFPGIAANRVNLTPNSKAATIIGTADVYKSDFGDLSMVPNPQMRNRDVWLVDPDMAELMTLRPVQEKELARTGDNERRLMLWEGTHKINNEAAHGAIADLIP